MVNTVLQDQTALAVEISRPLISSLENVKISLPGTVLPFSVVCMLSFFCTDTFGSLAGYKSVVTCNLIPFGVESFFFLALKIEKGPH